MTRNELATGEIGNLDPVNQDSQFGFSWLPPCSRRKTTWGVWTGGREDVLVVSQSMKT